MIFVARNERNEPTWRLALEGKKTVTRRLKPLPVGKEFAIQPGRGKFAVCRARVINCMDSQAHYSIANYREDVAFLKEYKKKEANLEGFNSWEGLLLFFKKKKIRCMDTYRIEYELVNSNIGIKLDLEEK